MADAIAQEVVTLKFARGKVLLDAADRDWAKRLDERGEAGSVALTASDVEMNKVHARN